jgi:hypothetical protein
LSLFTCYLIGCSLHAAVTAKISSRSWGIWLWLIPLWPLVVAWGTIDGLIALYVRLLAATSPFCAKIVYNTGNTLRALGEKHGGANA